MAALIDSEYELPILVGLCCRLRPTEFLALRWRDVDLDAGVLRVTQNVHGKDVHVPGSVRLVKRGDGSVDPASDLGRWCG